MWSRAFWLLAGGAAAANRRVGVTVGPDGDPGEIAKRLVALRAVRRGIEVAPAVEPDVAGDQAGPAEVSL